MRYKKMAKTFTEVTEKIRETLLDEFDELKEKKDNNTLTESDLDYCLARDRKSAIILKTLQMDLSYQTIQCKRGLVSSEPKKKIAQNE